MGGYWSVASKIRMMVFSGGLFLEKWMVQAMNLIRVIVRDQHRGNIRLRSDF
jgi:hypothetical protein